jgi:hypothetical protein
VRISCGDLSWCIVEISGAHLLETSSLSYEWIWFGELGFDIASCGFGKEI